MSALPWAEGPSRQAAALPPMSAPGASDDERASAVMARMVARFGAPSIEDYQRTYRLAGLEWPGDDEVRRRHAVAHSADTAPGTTA